MNGATTTYILDGSTILGEKRSDGTTIRYLYDESGTPYAFFYNSQVYYYVYNAQGDVIEIMSTSGSDIATYKYDAWGNVIGIGGDESIAELNPIRYRGYYYDNETGFYYLNSRYYDPEIGRFINADTLLDSTQSQLGVNLFTYCQNNPVIYSDANGHMALEIAIGGGLTIGQIVAIGVLAAAAVYFTVTAISNSVKQAVDTMDELLNNHDQSIYVLRDPKRNNQVVYVGRTNNTGRRKEEHKRKSGREDWEFHPIHTGLNAIEARVMEQFYISAYTLNQLEKARREISAKIMPKFKEYLNDREHIPRGYRRWNL